MKKQVILIAVAIFSFGVLQAQDIRFGAKAGVNFAKLTGDAVEDADGRTGFHIGGLVEFLISEKFSVQPELIYSQQGLQSKDEFGGVEVETKFKLDYINIPIMAKYYVTEGLSLEAGPQFGINTTAEFETELSGDDSNDEFFSGTEDVKDSTSGLDLGIGAGVGYRLDSGIFFQARYMFGVSDVGDDDEVFGDSLTNSVLSLSAGYSF
ncbi:porin family protein [Rasiella sp. SM2506]|uniref:porin family protein n=1 Tax=Rasiella sp. SM2506 TaxID=3423914 RepID=UPI003D7B27ED